MKKLTIFALVLCMLFVFAACGDGEIAPKSGTYVAGEGYSMSETGIPALKPFITLNADEGTFTFTFDPLSSYLPVGTYTVTEGLLTAKTSDGQYTYNFDVVDEGTLRFNSEGSSDITYSSMDVAVYNVAHGTTFVSTTAE